MTRRKGIFRRRVLWAWLLLAAFLPQWVMKSLHHHDACAYAQCCASLGEATSSAEGETTQHAWIGGEQHSQHSSASANATTHNATTQGKGANSELHAHSGGVGEHCPLCDFLFFPSTAASSQNFNFVPDFDEAAPILAQLHFHSRSAMQHTALRGPPQS